MRYYIIPMLFMLLCSTGCIHLSPVVNQNITGPGFTKPLSESTLLVGQYVTKFQPTGFAFGKDSSIGMAGDARAYGFGEQMAMTGKHSTVWEAWTPVVMGMQNLGVFQNVTTSLEADWDLRMKLEWSVGELKHRWPWYTCLHVPIIIGSFLILPPYPICPIEVPATYTISFWDREGNLLRAYHVAVKDKWLLHGALLLDIESDDTKYVEQAKAEAGNICVKLMKKDIRELSTHNK